MNLNTLTEEEMCCYIAGCKNATTHSVVMKIRHLPVNHPNGFVSTSSPVAFCCAEHAKVNEFGSWYDDITDESWEVICDAFMQSGKFKRPEKKYCSIEILPIHHHEN